MSPLSSILHLLPHGDPLRRSRGEPYTKTRTATTMPEPPAERSSARSPSPLGAHSLVSNPREGCTHKASQRPGADPPSRVIPIGSASGRMGGFFLYLLTLVPHATTHRVRSPQPSAQHIALHTGGKTCTSSYHLATYHRLHDDRRITTTEPLRIPSSVESVVRGLVATSPRRQLAHASEPGHFRPPSHQETSSCDGYRRD